MEERRDTKVPALYRAVSIMKYIGANGKCSGKAIVAFLNAPKSSVYLLLEEMKQSRLLSQGPDGNYQLGIKLIEFGEQAAAQLDIREVARKHLEVLTQETGLLGHLGVIDNNEAFYILKIESPSTIRVHSWEGKSLSLYCSGLGKCLLAWADEKVRDEFLKALIFRQYTQYTIDSREKLLEELAQIRRRGWAYDNQEAYLNVRCVAAPVFSSNGKLAAAVSAVGTTFQVLEDRIPELVQRVKRAAELISLEL